jgi:hypothetical protein
VLRATAARTCSEVRPWVRALVQILQRAGLNKGAIGVLGLDPYPPFYFDGPMPYNTWKTVQDSLPEAKFKRLGPQFLQMIATRSQEGLTYAALLVVRRLCAKFAVPP